MRIKLPVSKTIFNVLRPWNSCVKISLVSTQLSAMIKVLRILLFVFVFSGCVFSSHGDKAAVKKNYNEGAVKIIDALRLKEGGNLLFVPFRAGVGVSASEELDRVSLMLVKGFVETLQRGNFPFRILSAENAGDAELVIKGYITELNVSKKFSALSGGNKKLTLGIDGKMVDEKTDRALIHFSKKETTIQKSGNLMAMAYALGQEMATPVLEGLRP